MKFFSFFFKPKLEKEEKKELKDYEKKKYIEKRKDEINNKYKVK